MLSKIYGKFEYNNKIYPFFLEDNTVYVAQTAFEFKDDFKYTDEIDTIHGVTSQNYDIVLLKCAFQESLFNLNIRFTIKGYVISTINVHSTELNFDRLKFYSEALNTFYSPQKAIFNSKINPSMWNGAFAIHIKPFGETDITFDIQNNIKCTLGFDRWQNLKRELTNIGEIKTYISFEFNERQNVEKILIYYLNVFDILSFMNYSKNIPLEDIKLFAKDKDDKYAQIGKAVIFVERTSYKRNSRNIITFDDLPIEKLGVIFSELISIRDNDNRIQLYFPEDENDSQWINPEKWLSSALSFEGLFSQKYPNFKSNVSNDFKEVKEVILQNFEKAKEHEKYAGKMLKYYNTLKRQIENYDGILEEKFNYIFYKHQEALHPLITYLDKYNSSSTIDYGSIYVSYRNKLAHGAIEPLNNERTATYVILRAMVYILLLDNANLSENELQKILTKIFNPYC